MGHEAVTLRIIRVAFSLFDHDRFDRVIAGIR